MKRTELPERPESNRSAQCNRYDRGPHTRWLNAAAVISVAFVTIAPVARAQVAQPRQSGPAPIGPITYPTSDASDRIRLAQLAGDTSHLGSYLLRSPSTILFGDTAIYVPSQIAEMARSRHPRRRQQRYTILAERGRTVGWSRVSECGSQAVQR